MRPTAVMVLGAGLGTRLAPLTHELPKPLVWLGNKPLVDGIFDRLAAAGFRRAVMNTHWLPEAFDAAWRRAQPLELELVHEPVILGTAGALANASEALGQGDVLVWNADIAAEPELAALLERPRGSLLLLTGPPRPAGQGTLGLDAEGRVVRVRAYRGAAESYGADYAGIALVPERLRPRAKVFSCLVGDVILPALERNESVATAAIAAGFEDLGTPADYLAANRRWLASRSLERYVHPSATVQSGVHLKDTVVAAGAMVVGSGVLEDCVVWPGAQARAPLCATIVTPRTHYRVNDSGRGPNGPA